jgi:hypothetical protein
MRTNGTGTRIGEMFAVAGIAAGLAWQAAPITFAAAIAASVAWCVWLERHPAP